MFAPSHLAQRSTPGVWREVSGVKMLAVELRWVSEFTIDNTLRDSMENPGDG